MSPGFTPRPSLSAGRPGARRGRVLRVSPGFTPRPSLSGRPRGGARHSVVVSPGFTPRPSLSERVRGPRHRPVGGVAGVHAPAFVERAVATRWPGWSTCPGVAGVHAPAFVERCGTPTRPVGGCVVSPGFTPRPSLSGADRVGVCRVDCVSPGFTPGTQARTETFVRERRPAFVERAPAAAPAPATSAGVAGVHAPAFVERMGG